MSILSWLPMVLSAASTISSIKGIKAEGAYEAGMMQNNAMFARLQAGDALSRGESTSMQAAVKARMMAGSQRAAMAAQGIDISSGSALDVQVDTKNMADLDIMVIRNNAAREAWGYTVQSTDYAGKAVLTDMAAKNKVHSTLLTGGLQTLRLFPN